MNAARLAFLALASTLAIQIYTSFASSATAVLAPVIAPALHIAPKWIGAFIGLVYAGAMAGSVACGGFIERYGAIRVSQTAVVVCALGVLGIALVPADSLALLAVAPIVIGLGYGPITPASSQLLARTAPPSRMALTFSIKQTGVPIGAAMSGALLPVLADAVGWRVTFLLVAALGVLVVGSAEPIRKSLDVDRKTTRLSLTAMLAPLVVLVRTPALLELALISLVYSATQVCLTSFLVIFLHDTLGWSLIGAGLALTAATLGGVAGRIGWGIVADRTLSPRRVLGCIGVAAGSCGAALAVAETTWPVVALVALLAVFGATAIGWNGVQLAAVARHAPAGAAGAVTGASGFVTFAGVVLGPPLFGLLSSATGSYRIGFAVFAFLSTLGGVGLLVHRSSVGAKV